MKICVLILAAGLAGCSGARHDRDDDDSADNGGDPGGAGLTPSEADACTASAWGCAFDAAIADPAADQARVRSMLDDCLAATTTADGSSCARACEDAGAATRTGRAFVCAEIATDVAALARQDGSCRSELEDCLAGCIDRADNATEGDRQRPFAQCWTLGLTSDCPFYVRDLDGCGGNLDRDSNDGCLARCEATHGAWSSDLDETCENQCIF